MDSRAGNRAQAREFLVSRRERITPEEAGLPAYGGGNRRVKGLRREEVALLAGVSIDYYVRMERGNLAGASDAVLDGLATALTLLVYTAPAGTPTADGLKLLASWDATPKPPVARSAGLSDRHAAQGGEAAGHERDRHGGEHPGEPGRGQRQRKHCRGG
ncbi:hypothetical protein BCD48_19385 [Pseudofrankia sp. BMG5.36]|nr:hypothetical protein BCD48_19385 [Pseudofrankia sp. BMG5.36]